MSFNQFRLRSDILKGLKDVKIESPSPLQKKIFKNVQEGSDLVINTTIEQQPEVGYLISMLNKISESDRRQGTRAIILAATKERAKELDEWIWAIGYHASIESACFTEDETIEQQMSALSAGPVVLVATPGRLAEMLEKGRMVFREVHQFIVDQSELVQNWDAVEIISKRIIGNCQRIFTAASDSQELRDAEKSLLQDPTLVTVTPNKGKQKKEEEPAPPVITKDLTQYYINVPPRSKISTLMAHLDNNKSDTVVIFTASRRTADRLYKILRKSNRRAVSIHNQTDKKTFDERFGRFTSGNVQHLVVGELSADDLPLEHATQVINYDVPEDVNEYKLRAELVGSGKATRILSLVSKQDRGDIRTISESLGYAPEEVPLPKKVKQKSASSQPHKSKNSKTQRRGNKKSSQKNPRRPKPDRKQKTKSSKPYSELPRPTFDQLSGGRSGKKKKKGVVGFIKKLFRN